MYPTVVIRLATKEDLDSAVQLVVRLKRLNAEFDPMLEVIPDIEQAARKYLENALNSPSSVLLVAAEGSKVVGLLKGDVEDRIFYKPRYAGVIKEFYILPEYRRKGIGKRLMMEGVEQLRKKGAEIIMASFPALNEIAINFYKKMGFRPIEYLFAKEV
ncbi:GNAT family N-acetyltransferase [Pyrobaculum aerophilum]|uniref:GNAT family N-acetyltransferase n=1 Tax=Pyrobaculum aerophilum TaxID=13773 RepID=A0A371QV95_9CREN|nr:GNAT family N-acetyltransferase [Pyrobaculum aerophilum]RFA93928.1 GNAT family N-acetyltransferase [Pyrobaculum aerophilum]RFA94685.1 GNAT family N-acetyltransferase [Pyrobaculum aerophilum]